MAKWYEAANDASFKPVAEGYVFQQPNPWVFAPPRYYLINETQKAAILAHMGRWRLFQLISNLAIVAVFGSFVALLYLSPAASSWLAMQGLGLGVSTAVLVTLLVAPLIAAPLIYLNHGLRTRLEHAPRTKERITMGEQLPKIAGVASGTVVMLGLVSGVCLMGVAVLILVVGYVEGHPSRSLLFLPIFAFGALVTVYFVHLMRLSVRS